MQCRKVFSYCLVRRSRGPIVVQQPGPPRAPDPGAGPVLVPADADLLPRPHRERERWVADGADMLLAEQVIELSEDGHSALDGVHEVGVEPGVAEVEIAVGKNHRVSSGQVRVVEVSRVVGTAGEGTLECSGKLGPRILHREEATMRRAPEGSRAHQRVV